MSSPALTIVRDVLYSPDGDLVSGSLQITNSNTFITFDGFEVPQDTTLVVPVVDGNFSIGLCPNLGAIPSGTSYFVKYKVTSQWFVETWIVPQSPNPCKLSDVRALTPPIPEVMIPIDQILPQSNILPGQVEVWDGTQWVPGAGGGGGGNYYLNWFYGI